MSVATSPSQGRALTLILTLTLTLTLALTLTCHRCDSETPSARLTHQVITAATPAAGAASLVSLVDEGRKLVPLVYYADGGGLYEGAAATATLP